MERSENLLKQLLERGDCPCDNSIIYANGEIDYLGFSNGKPSILGKSSIDDYFASEPEAWFELHALVKQTYIVYAEEKEVMEPMA